MLLTYDNGIEEILERQDEIQRHVLVSKLKRKDRQRFYGQEYPATCGQACIRTILYNHYGLRFKNTETLIELEEELYKKVQRRKRQKRSRQYKIIENGTSTYHFENLADFLGLRIFSSNHGRIKDMIYLLENRIWPIIFRPSEKEKNREDDSGHYLVLYKNQPKSETFKMFDPAYPWTRPNEEKRIIHEGTHKIEDYEKFNYNWTYKNDTARGYLFFCKPDADIKKLKGRFL